MVAKRRQAGYVRCGANVLVPKHFQQCVIPSGLHEHGRHIIMLVYIPITYDASQKKNIIHGKLHTVDKSQKHNSDGSTWKLVRLYHKKTNF